jgi:eukaryotic-like serine/threonine-protein kinase
MSDRSGHPTWEQIEQVMAAVLELPEDQRSAYLSNQSAAIRAEVESLLAASRNAGDFLGSGVSKPIADMLTQMKSMFAAANPEVLASHTRLYSERAAAAAAFAVSAGTQLGPYRIESLIGKGGMGVVYRALDIRLNRPVAVKFLSEGLADPAARRRFQREAQMASALNHPHILTVHDAGDFEGRQYLVTEFVDGGTLREWARAEKRTWRETVALLVGVADGLATAHAAGILHRDIKPDNILVAKNGYAKLSDFGLAKLEERVGPENGTQTLDATGPGMIIGTFPYMSPEQACGRQADARADIFSFGILLYEMLAGRRPFTGKTDKELLQNIVHGTAPPLSADVPVPLRMIVEKALENAPADRYQSTRDLVVDLRRLTRQTESGLATATPPAANLPQARQSWKIAAIAMLLVVALAIVAAVIWPRLQRPAAQVSGRVVQFDISPPPGTIFAPSITRQPFALSPDGKRLAFGATGANGTNIWIRDLSSLDQRVVSGTEGAWSIFWSQDSQSIFFSVKRTLKQANLDTGSGRTVAELPDIAQFGTWGSTGDLMLYLGAGDIYELRLKDGNLTKGHAFEGMRWPQFLPGGDRLVYVVYDRQLQHGSAIAADYGNRATVSLMQTDSRVQYTPPLRPGEPGYLLFIRGASLLAQPFDADKLRLAGEPVAIAQNVIYYGPTLSTSFSASDNGVLVYQAGFPDSQLKWYDRTGKEVSEVGRPAPYWGQVRVSHDGKRVVASVWSPENGGTGLWLFSAAGRESRRLTFPPEVHRRAVWAPDGTRLAFGRSLTVGGPRLATVDVTGNAVPEEFVGDTADAHISALPTDWSADGQFIVLDDGVGEEQHVVWIADVARHKLAPLLKNSFAQWGAAFSPDGKRIAFVSLESGRPEVYVQAFESTPVPHVVGERRQVSKDSAWLVRWRSDGRELYYLGLDNLLQAVPVQGPLQFGEPKPLFRIAGAPQYGTTRDFQFDVSPDGQQFILLTTGSVAPPPFTVIENWQARFFR